MPFSTDRYKTYLQNGSQQDFKDAYETVTTLLEQGVGGNEIERDTLKQAMNQQIQVGEQYLEDNERKEFSAEQTTDGQPFVLDSEEKANKLIREGELALVAVGAYDTFFGRAPSEVEKDFIEKAGIDIDQETDRLIEIYGADKVRGPKDDQSVDFPEEVGLNKQFKRRGW